ncbi:MAG: phosphatase PAP2 family protein [Candidatus Bathyarchaeia archaeon]
MLPNLNELDLWLFNLINQSWANPPLDPVMIAVTYMGELFLWYSISLILWHWKGFRVAVPLLIGLIIGDIAVFLIKYLALRPSPYSIVSSVRLLPAGLRLPGEPSFPSGHACRSFIGAVILGRKFSRWRCPLLGLATMISISRIYVGVHWPSDVLAGAFIGVSIGLCVLKSESRIVQVLQRIKLKT